MQRFYESTIVSDYIKYLLESSAIPVIPTIRPLSVMIKGCMYIYKNYILKCTETGKFVGVDSEKYYYGNLTVSDFLKCSNSPNLLYCFNTESKQWEPLGSEGKLYVTNKYIRYEYDCAKYEVVGNYNWGQKISNISNVTQVTSATYDSFTHKLLGEYLRCLRDIKGLDLMSLYNCFNYEFSDSFRLDYGSMNSNETYILEDDIDESSKLVLVPIKFNESYTLAVECLTPYYMKPVLYDGTKVIHASDDSQGKHLVGTEDIGVTCIRCTGTRFHDTQTVRFSTESYELKNMEKYLYLAVQLPVSCNSTFIVLEGVYSNEHTKYIFDAQTASSSSEVDANQMFKTAPSLLAYDSNTQIPFADKLISYLVEYTIDSREYFDENIERVQRKMMNPQELNKLKDSRKLGSWTNRLRYKIYQRYFDQEKKFRKSDYDILGYVDRDTEYAIDRGVMIV